MIAFRHCDSRFPFLWEGAKQPPARWHDRGQGPAHYFADTSNGAWAEFLRHEAIRDPDDLATVQRAMWAVDVPDEPSARPQLTSDATTGDATSYAACRAEAKRLRDRGARRLEVPSAALLPGGAAGQVVSGGLVDTTARNGRVLVLFGPRPDLVGWQVVSEGRPSERLLALVRHL
ncbi:MAG: RES domain-containing protein [Polyangiaceae bacterium]